MQSGTSPKGVLIVGGNSFLGAHLCYALRKDFRVISAAIDGESFPIEGVSSVRIDFKEELQIRNLVYRTAPDYILYLGGSHSVAWNEKNSKISELHHANGAGELIKHSELFHTRVIYFSTCYVYDGHRGNYKEQDTLSPSLTLGKYKVGGENLVKSRSSNYLILRVPPIYGKGHPYRSGFLDLLRMRLTHSKPVELQNYELYNFASAFSVTETVRTILNQGVRKGIYHYGGLSRLTHFELGTLFAQKHGLNENLIAPIKQPYSGSMISSDNRLDYSLNSSEIMSTYGVKNYEIEDALEIDPFFR
ncbi:MAG: NAD-dependent epimerase/dehydratase family protein [Proteobacteria bacterium]|nr:MAG: NAD-dependent epimerase/dehydratase family protein [Pseudomonadota bacterium]